MACACVTMSSVRPIDWRAIRSTIGETICLMPQGMSRLSESDSHSTTTPPGTFSLRQ